MTKHIVIDARGRRSSSGRYIDRLIEHLQKLDTQNRYTILLEPGDNWHPTATNFGVQTCSFKKFSFNLLDQITFARYLKNLKPDLVHFWMTPQEPAFYSGKRITTTHDLTMFDFTRRGRLPGWLHTLRMIGYRWLFKVSLKKARTVITPTNYVKEELARLYPVTQNKTVVTHEASEPQITAEAEKPSKIKAPFLLYVGSAFPHKNLEKLIKAFEIVNTSQPKLNLVLVGKKEQYYKELERLTQYSPARENIIFTGFVPDEQLKWLYKNAEAYVFPSLSEGFGLPGLEAMVHGCPVISSNATCLPEIYGDAAAYFDPKDTKGMAEKIESVLTNGQLRDRLIVKGHQQAKKYSWERMAQQTLTVYQSLLKD